MRVAILHDYFNKMGGGERVVLGMAKAFDADIYTGFVNHENTYESIKDYNVKEIARDIGIGGIRNIHLMNRFSKLELDYDFFIFSGNMCISAVEKNKPSLLYCHTPPRFMYDLREWFMKNSNFFQRVFLELLTMYMKPKDQHYMRQFDRIVVNSKNVQQRLLKYYGKDVYDKDEVVYSMIDQSKFTYKKTGDFFLSFGRLDKLKRVDVIVRAFQKMPEKKLVVVSGGPELENIKEMAKDYANIEVLGYVSDQKLFNLVGTCLATIYIPVNEDMGLTPLESNSAGKPCIGANEGGPTELIKHNKTGWLIEPDEKSLIETVQKITPEKVNNMRKDCEEWADNFSEDKFIARIRKVMDSMGIDNS